MGAFDLYLYLYDGTTKIYLTSNTDNVNLIKYYPTMPEMSHLDAVAEAVADGGERLITTRRNVTEEIEVMITGTDVADMETHKQAIELYLRQAETYQNSRKGAQIFLHFSAYYGTWEWRSEVLSGQVEWDEDVLEAGQWNAKQARATITLTRRWFWEGNFTQIPLTNVHGTGTLNGIQVDNHNDAGHSNFVSIPADTIIGAIPTPVYIYIKNNRHVGPTNFNTIQCACNVFSDPLNIDHWLEAEDGTGGTACSDADPSGYTYSGGAARKWTTIAATETELIYWELPDTALIRTLGHNFLLTARQAQVSRAAIMKIKVKLKIYYNDWHTVWEGPWQNVNDSDDMQSLGVVRLPPYLPGTSPYATIRLYLYAKYAPASGTYYLDYLQLSPMDGIRGYFSTLTSAGLYTSHGLVDDGLAETLYVQEVGGGNMAATYRAIGPPIMLHPKRAHRLYFLWNDTDGIMVPAYEGTAILYYRPRVLTP